VAETPSFGDLLLAMADNVIGRLTTALPAQIVTYDPATQTAHVKPTVAARYHEPESDTLLPLVLPDIANVPVIFPLGQGGAASFTWPLIPGDTVLLVICDRSIDEWKATGLPENLPQDIRRFDLTDAVAFAGLHPLNRPISAAGWAEGATVLQSPDIRLGSSAASKFLATQPDLLVELGRISAALAAVGGLYTPGVAPAPVPVADPTLCAALKVKAE
jgi:hypothetical protein